MIQSIRSILVALTKEAGPPEESAAAAYALALAREAGAHLTVGAGAETLRLASPWIARVAAALVAAENARVGALARTAADEARRAAAAAGVAVSASAPSLGHRALVGHLAAVARVHDLVVVDAEPEPLHPDRDLLRALLLRSGRPLIVVPAGWPAARPRRILVAWDGGGLAARAAHDALPLLRAAEAVRIVTVPGEAPGSSLGPSLGPSGGTEGEGGAEGADLAAHLARHGVPAEAVVRPAPGGDAAQALRLAAAEHGSGMIVLGGAVRSPLGELILGGVTGSLLGEGPVPLLMSR